MCAQPTRRRFIGLSAAAAGLSLLPFGGGQARAAAACLTWHGVALGAPAEMVLHHPDRSAAKAILARAVIEIERLERILSLYRPDSALSELNRLGALASPPPELVDLLRAARRFWALSDGLFDPTVQPLWLLHARHFAIAGADPAGPPQQDVNAALRLVGFDHVAFDRSRVALTRRGMALTLNGIAQGFITDRIVEMLRDAGITSTLADLGEIRVLGAREDGAPWQVGIGGDEDQRAEVLALADQAIATSSPGGFRFAGPGSPSHLLDPRDGISGGRYRGVSVLAGDATTADALSTAFSFMAPERVAVLLESLSRVSAYLVKEDGRPVRLG